MTADAVEGQGGREHSHGVEELIGWNALEYLDVLEDFLRHTDVRVGLLLRRYRHVHCLAEECAGKHRGHAPDCLPATTSHPASVTRAREWPCAPGPARHREDLRATSPADSDSAGASPETSPTAAAGPPDRARSPAKSGSRPRDGPVRRPACCSYGKIPPSQASFRR